MEEFEFIDLFSGIGGFHQGMEALGGHCVFASDIDTSCRQTYNANYGLEPAGDITQIDAEDIPEHDVLCGGFPCQAFSKAGNRLGFADPTKGTLFFDIVRILEHHQPRYALLENVRNLASHDHGNTWRVIHDKLEQIGYNLLPEPVIFSPHYIGIPQHRERVYIMCVRNDVGEVPPFHFDYNHLAECHIESIMQPDNEIENIDELRLSPQQTELLNLWEEFIHGIHSLNGNDYGPKKLPGFPVWADRLCPLDSEENLDAYPAWKKNFILKNNALYEANREFIDEWLTRAHQCPLFFGAKAKLEWQAGLYENPSLWDHILQFRPSGIRIKPGTYFPALVAITQTSIVGRRRRQLSLRECARLQSFPDTFQPDVNEAQAYKQFGNAVNVDMVKLFAGFMFGDPVIRHAFSAENENPDYSAVLNYLNPELVNRINNYNPDNHQEVQLVNQEGNQTHLAGNTFVYPSNIHEKFSFAHGNVFDYQSLGADGVAAIVKNGFSKINMTYQDFIAENPTVNISTYIYNDGITQIPRTLREVQSIINNALDDLVSQGSRLISIPCVHVGNADRSERYTCRAIRTWLENGGAEKIDMIYLVDADDYLVII